MSLSDTCTEPVAPTGSLSRVAVFAYSLLAYAVGMAALAWLIACAAGLYWS